MHDSPLPYFLSLSIELIELQQVKIGLDSRYR